MLERRKCKRYSLPLPAAVEFAIIDDLNFEKTRLINISLGGVCFESAKSVDVGSVIDLRLHDLDTHLGKELGFPIMRKTPLNIKIQGEVLRADQPEGANDNWRLAVKFISPMRIIV